MDVAGSDRVHRRPVRGIQRPAERAGAASLRRALDRRWSATGQGRRRVLHVASRRRIAHPRELLTGLRRRHDARARARSRLPQPERGRPYSAATADADDSGGNGQHILRDARQGGRAGRCRAGREDLHPGAVSSRRLPGGRRYSQPVRFRTVAVRRPSRAGALDRRAESVDAGGAGGNVRRRAGQRRSGTRTCGRSRGITTARISRTTTTPICSDCSSGLACTRSTGRSQTRSRIATTRSWRRPGEPAPPIWPRDSTSTCVTAVSGGRACAVIRDDIDRLEELAVG